MLLTIQILLIAAQLFLVFILSKEIRRMKNRRIEDLQDEIESVQDDLDFAAGEIKRLNKESEERQKHMEEVVNKFTRLN